MSRPDFRTGFTLAEILITLALMAIVATFTIAKIGITVDTQQRDATFKKTYNVLQSILDQGMTTGNLMNTNEKTYFLDGVTLPVNGGASSYQTGGIRAIRKCRTNYITENCLPSVTGITGTGFVLHGGAAVVGFKGAACTDACGETIAVDWNGSSGPNVEGKDIILLNISYGTLDFTSPGGVIVKPGAILPEPTSVALFNKAVYNK